jgi:hypothetical protein
MPRWSTFGNVPRALLRHGLALAALATAIGLPLGAIAPAFAADEAPSAADQRCLGCHGGGDREKTLADGDILRLQVPAETFAKSVHGLNGCASCHTDIIPSVHPVNKKDIKTARSYSVAATEVCRGCHADKFTQWEGSIHGTLVRNGNPAAPICTDCHSPHAVMKGAAAKIDEIPCQKCHKDIFTAYQGSVHAKSLHESADSYAPICTGCHSAHDIKPISFGAGPTAACLGCHVDVLEAHAKWLPNAALHFEVVSCPACHVPTAQRKVDLMLIDGDDNARGTQELGVPLFDASNRSDGKGIDAMTLWRLLQTFNREGLSGKTVVRGRLKVSTGPQAHQIAPKSQAVRSCTTCHRDGSAAFQSVTISLVGPDGRRVGYGANADVLSSPVSIDTVRGFYAIGGTRIKILDILLIMALLGGLAVPVGHLTIGWIFKRYGLAQPHGGSGGTGAGEGGPAAG